MPSTRNAAARPQGSFQPRNDHEQVTWHGFGASHIPQTNLPEIGNIQAPLFAGLKNETFLQGRYSRLPMSLTYSWFVDTDFQTALRLRPSFVRAKGINRQSSSSQTSSRTSVTMVEDDAASTKSALTLPSVREGPARLKECGRRRFFSHDGWLKLNNAELSFSSSHKFGRRSLVLPLTHIDTLERTVLVSSGLVLKTKFGDRFLLKFATERELYDWQDAICLRTNRIGLPYNVAHNHHGTLDPETGTLRGLPVAWDRVDRTLPKKSARGFPETSSLASSSAADITSILRVRFDTLSEPLGNGALVSTHIAVTQTTALLGVLERACGTRNVHPADHALSLDNLRPLPNDTTVAELGGQLDLSLIKRVYTAADEVTIRVCLKLSPDEIHIGDLSIAPNMRIFDVRQLICSQRKLIAETYLVAVSGSVEFLSMNSLVWDLHGRHNLVLIKRLRAGASLSN